MTFLHILPLWVVGEHFTKQADALRKTLGSRRYGIALLCVGQKLTQLQVARRIRVNRSTVSRDVKIIADKCPAIRYCLPFRK